MIGLLFFVLMLGLTGCMDQRVVIPTQPVREKADNYKLNEVQKAQVGEAVLFGIDAKYYDGLMADNDFTPVNIQFANLINSQVAFGQKWVVAGKMADGSLVAHLPSKYMFSPGGALTPREYSMLVVDKESKQVVGKVKILSDNFPAQPIKHLYYDFVANPSNVFKTSRFYVNGSKKRELIYNGKSKSNIKLMYREFVDQLQDPKMQQDVQYDLAESNVISFQGYNIEVVEATNSEIKYKIVSVPKSAM